MNNYLVEFLGTLFLIYVILSTNNPLAIGAAVTVILIISVKSSGGNFNPAVSLTMVAAGKLPSSEFIPYILAQFAGGLAALQLYNLYK